MPLLDIWAKTPDQLEDKQIHQLIAFAGGGKLLDDSPCSSEFREFLATVPSKKLEIFSAQCLEQAFQDSGMALQDIVNEIGVRLGAKSTRGRYRGVKNQNGVDGIKASPVAFHEACVKRIQSELKVSLVKRSRSGYSTPDDAIALNCSVSKEHNPESNPNYWFAFHPHQQAFLEKHSLAYVAFGCGSSERLVLVPYATFKPWLQNTWVTENGDRTYWHVVIYRDDETYALRLKKGSKAIDLTPYVVASEV